MISRRVMKQFIKETELDIDLFADVVGVSTSAVYAWLRGRNQPSRLALLRMADVANCIDSTFEKKFITEARSKHIRSAGRDLNYIRGRMWEMETSWDRRKDAA